MPETSAEEALSCRQQCCTALMNTRFRMKHGLELSQRQRGPCHLPARDDAVHAIIGAADARMYEVKSNGRGKVRGA